MFVGFTVAAGQDLFDENISLVEEPIDCKLSGRDTGGALSVFEFAGMSLGPRHLHTHCSSRYFPDGEGVRGRACRR